MLRRLRAGIEASGIKAAGIQNRRLNGTGESRRISGGGSVRSSDEISGNRKRAKGLNQSVSILSQPNREDGII